MKQRTVGIMAGLIGVACLCSLAFSGEIINDFSSIPAKGTVTMIDLGAKKCIPCKMMAPIMEKLENVYEDKADIVFIDVWENNDQARRFGIRGIPTQIFFDQDGKEIYRHTGFMDETAIVGQLTSMGVPAPENQDGKKKDKR